MDILQAKENIIVHQVNELGVMGAGLALQIKNKYPEVYTKYKAVANKECLGKIQMIKIGENKYICNMFSQRGISRTHKTTDYELMELCMSKLSKYSKEKNLTIAIPYKIGCGLAGGDWNTVTKIIEKHIPNAVVYKK
jgi:O-acetyl-ADP-ribose deacetylase (regulator of RNase III)